MTFGLFLPEEANDGPVPVLWYLSGLTCTHENAMTKAGAQVWAAEHGIALTKREYLPLELSVQNRAAQMAIKRALDPRNVLNPGKIFPEA